MTLRRGTSLRCGLRRRLLAEFGGYATLPAITVAVSGGLALLLLALTPLADRLKYNPE